MNTREEAMIQHGLEHERRTMRRQELLRRLWKLRQSRAEEEEFTGRAESAKGGTSFATTNRARALTCPDSEAEVAPGLQA